MKNLSVAMNVILFIAVAVLYYLHFKKSNAGDMDQSAVKLPVSNVGIVFVNSDSLLNGYDFYKAKKTEFEEAQAKVKAELKSQGDKLQQEVQDYQKKAEA